MVIAACLTVLGCSDEERRSLDQFAISTDLQARTAAAVEAAGSAVDGMIECDVDISDDDALTAECHGQDAGGNPVATTLTGTVDLEAAECDGVLTITLGSDNVVENPSFDCLD